LKWFNFELLDEVEMNMKAMLEVLWENDFQPFF
jgi:hypothetical protein